MERMELPNQDRIRTLEEKETYETWASLSLTPLHKWRWMKKIKKEYLCRTKKILETKLSSINLIKEMNSWAVSLVRYSGPFLKWTREELEQMDQRTRKPMTIHNALHPGDYFDILYVSRKEGGRRLTSTENTVDASIQWFEEYI